MATLIEGLLLPATLFRLEVEEQVVVRLDII